jgi:hypothetical protein
MNTVIGAQWGTMHQARQSTVRRTRRASRAMSVGLLVLATVLGVRLGLGGPTVSPVSPAAIAARYGAPPPAALAQRPVAEQGMQRGRQRDEHGRGRP